MKRMLFFGVLLVPLVGFAQAPHPILKSFSAYKQPNGIILRWAIKGGNQCQGTRILRAGDDLMFDEAGQIPGICGSFTEDETYSFFDSVPLPNAYNHYKLELGFQGFTDTLTVFYENFGSSDHVLLSDHASGEHRILFSNDLGNKAVLRIFDRSGHEIYTETSTDSDFTIRPTGWRSGIYLFRISGVSEVDIHGKIYFGD